MRLPEEQDKNLAYASHYKNEKEVIKKLLQLGKEVTYSRTNSFVVIDGKTYNGINRETIKYIMEQICEK